MAGGLLSRLTWQRKAQARAAQGEAPAPSIGQVYGFATTPLSEFAAPQTGRHAALKIIDVTRDHVAIAVLDGIWRDMPTLKEARKASLLHEHRFMFKGAPATLGVARAFWSPDALGDMTLLGDAAVSRAEEALAVAIRNFEPGSRFGSLQSANHSSEGEWRWAHDRAALEAETAQVRAREDAKRAAQEARYRDRLKHLTWDKLSDETPLARWTGEPPYPSAEFTAQARRAILEACEALKALGDKPRKADVRAVLKRCVEWFNAADERDDGPIETEEREDICAVLEEMAFVAKQRSLVTEIDDWRTW